MSARNRPVDKAWRRTKRSLRKGRVDTYIDLVAWVKTRSGVSTRQARNIILSGALRFESHKLGYEEINGIKYLKRYVPAELNTKITIVTPDVIKDAA